MLLVKKGDITEEECDAIVNPANSLGIIGGGVALAIKKKGGEVIEKEAMEKAPIKVGEAIATKAGKLKCKYVIHSPTMEKPAQKIPVENVRIATRAALELAKKLNLKSIAFPGMGTGVGGVSYEDAAKVMVEECRKFKDLEIRLIAFDSALYKIFKKFVKNEKEKMLGEIAEEIRKCEECKRNKFGLAVPGKGNADAKILFLGEAPGPQESKKR